MKNWMDSIKTGTPAALEEEIIAIADKFLNSKEKQRVIQI